MKKFLLSMAALAMSASFANADTLYELTFNKNNNQSKANDYVSTWKVKSEGNLWTLVAFNNFNNAGGVAGDTEWTWVRCGRKNDASVASIATDFALTGKINEIVLSIRLNAANSKTDNIMSSAYVQVSTTDQFDANSIVSTVQINSDEFKGSKNLEKDITVALDASATGYYYKIVFDMIKAGNNGWLQINSVKYNGESAGPQLADPEISFPAESYDGIVGTTFESPVATAKSNGVITYSISNDNVATIDAQTGVVTLVGDGTAVVTATIEATDAYKAGSASYTLNVTDPTIIYRSTLGEDFEFENVEDGDKSYPWSHDDKYGLKGSAFINSQVAACEGVAFSPVLDMTKYEDVKLDFSNAFNYYKVDNNMISVADFNGYAYVVARVEGATEWTVIDDAITAPAEFSWDFYPNATVDLKAFDGKKMQFGFKYVSTEYCAGTWEVKDITIKAKNATGVAGFEVDDNAPAVYYNLQGVRVANPENGLYIEVKGGKSRKVIF